MSGRRPGGLPLAAHAAALALVLIALLPLTRPGMSFMSDEGAAVLQARVLERTGSWLQHDPLADLDPERRARPVPLADTGPAGRAPYAKHPAYPVALLAAQRLAGTTGLYLLSMAGTVLAALGSALLARRIVPGADRATLWLVGLGTPLLFYAFSVQAHSLGAAAAVAAVLGAVVTLSGGRPWALLLVVLGVGAAAALRSEGVLLGLALASAAIVVGVLVRPRSPGRAVAVASAAVVAVLLVRAGERAFLQAVLGRDVGGATGAPAVGSPSFLADKAKGLSYTWFTPSYQGGMGDLFLLAAMLAVAAAAALLRVGRPPVLAVASLAAAAAAYTGWLVVGRPAPIPGLAIAAPLVWAGLWSTGRHAVRGQAARVAAVTAAVFAAAVMLTQYRGGGSVEWGGRYFLLAVPVVAPVLVGSIWAAASHAPGRLRLIGAGCGLACVAVLAVGAVRVLASSHQSSQRLLTALRTTAADAAPAGRPLGDSRPVVLSSEQLLPQLAWPDYDRYRWLVPDQGDLGLYAGRLRLAGVDKVMLVTADPGTHLPVLSGHYTESSRFTGRLPSSISVVVMEANRQ